jgi:hypothetical protein
VAMGLGLTGIPKACSWCVFSSIGKLLLNREIGLGFCSFDGENFWYSRAMKIKLLLFQAQALM